MRMPELAFLNVYPYPLIKSHRKKFSLEASVNCTYPWPEVTKKNSCSTQLRMKFFPLNNCWHFNINKQEKKHSRLIRA